MKFDYLVVGSGFFGAICAKHLHDQGKSVVVVEKRNHIGGNCYTEQKDGINIHTYGPHIFHTNNPTVWVWINQFAEFKPFRLQTMATAKGEVYSLPFSMFTFEKAYNATTPQEAMDSIARDCEGIGEAENLETAAIKKVGRKVYELLIKAMDAGCGNSASEHREASARSLYLRHELFQRHLPRHSRWWLYADF